MHIRVRARAYVQSQNHTITQSHNHTITQSHTGRVCVYFACVEVSEASGGGLEEEERKEGRVARVLCVCRGE
jgi:hypothetical protein